MRMYIGPVATCEERAKPSCFGGASNSIPGSSAPSSQGQSQASAEAPRRPERLLAAAASPLRRRCRRFDRRWAAAPRKLASVIALPTSILGMPSSSGGTSTVTGTMMVMVLPARLFPCNGIPGLASNGADTEAEAAIAITGVKLPAASNGGTVGGGCVGGNVGNGPGLM